MASEGAPLLWYTVTIADVLKVVQNISIPLPSNISVTVLQYIPHDNIIVLGSRHGSLIIFDFSTLQTVVLYRRAHGKDAITGLFVSNIQSNSWHIKSCGRDGVFSEFTATKDLTQTNQAHIECMDGWSLTRTSSTRITKGRIEGMLIVGATTMVIGLYDHRLFVYDVSKRYEMWGIKCGTKQWDFKSSSEILETFGCCFIRDGAAVMTTREGKRPFLHPVLKDPFQCLETRAVSFISLPGLVDTVIVSGGEDEELQFHVVDFRDETFKKVAAYRTHLASIRCLFFLPESGYDTCYLFSGGAEQKLKAWRVTTYPDRVDPISCVEVANAPISGVLESRVMDVAAIRSGGKVLVATANSDGDVRLWELCRNSIVSFVLVDRSDAHNRCVQKAVFATIGGGVHLFTAATDGSVIMWVVDGGLREVERWRIHQSGIKALSCRVFDGVAYVCTGGDDNAVAVLVVSFIEKVVKSEFLMDKNAHGSSVVGCFMSNRSQLYSVSIDQRLNVYRLEEGKMVWERAVYFDVADAGDADYLIVEGTVRIAVVGHGIQILNHVA